MGKFVFTWKRSVKKRSRCIQWEISGMHCALAFTILLWLASQDPCSDDPLNGKRHSVIFSVKKDGFCHSLEQTAPFIQLWVDFRIWMSQQKLQLCYPFEIPNWRYDLEFFNSGDYQECRPRNQFEGIAYFCHSSFSENLLQLLFFVWSTKIFRTDGI